MVARWGVFLLLACCAALAAGRAASAGTVLGLQGTRFTVNGRPAFLLGISYYGGLGASRQAVSRDLDQMKRLGINWIRVWATWSNRGSDVSAVDASGTARPVYMARLKRLVAECDRRGMLVDVTLSRSKGAAAGAVTDMAAHRRAVRGVVGALGGRRNWYLDLANERDVGDGRFVPVPEVRELRELARELAPRLLVTASFGGHDLDGRHARDALVEARLDFVAPHRPREAGSPSQTEAATRACLVAMQGVGVMAPIHYQEPFRTGYGDWDPRAEDFAADLEGALAGGAAGWCLHNGENRKSPDGKPRASFDLVSGALFDQLDGETLRFLKLLPGIMSRAGKAWRAGGGVAFTAGRVLVVMSVLLVIVYG